MHETSLTIGDGELFILVGPSGCGKSTLLNMIVGLEDVSSGEIRVDGRRVNDLDPKDRNMAMVFQSYAIYPHMTVRDNIAFPLKLAKLSKTTIRQKVEQAAELLELTELLDRKPALLSGGQRQRVAMGRALVREPDVFLLDEPLSNLDARLRVQMRGEIARLQKRLGTTMIYVTHDQTEAMTLGDRVAILYGGAVQQVGSPRQLYRNPANLFVAGFIGSPGMNFVPARVAGGKLVLPFGEVPLPEHLTMSRQQVVAGFRPEDLSVATSDDGGNKARLIFSLSVDVVEWLGAEVLVYSDFDAPAIDGAYARLVFDKKRFALVSRLESTMTVKRGESLRVAVDVNAMHFFDPETGANLLQQTPVAEIANR